MKVENQSLMMIMFYEVLPSFIHEYSNKPCHGTSYTYKYFKSQTESNPYVLCIYLPVLIEIHRAQS